MQNGSQVEWILLAAPQGFEPRYADPESAVDEVYRETPGLELLCFCRFEPYLNVASRWSSIDRGPFDCVDIESRCHKIATSFMALAFCYRGRPGRADWDFSLCGKRARLCIVYPSWRRICVQGEDNAYHVAGSRSSGGYRRDSGTALRVQVSNSLEDGCAGIGRGSDPRLPGMELPLGAPEGTGCRA